MSEYYSEESHKYDLFRKKIDKCSKLLFPNLFEENQQAMFVEKKMVAYYITPELNTEMHNEFENLSDEYKTKILEYLKEDTDYEYRILKFFTSDTFMISKSFFYICNKSDMKNCFIKNHTDSLSLQDNFDICNFHMSDAKISKGDPEKYFFITQPFMKSSETDGENQEEHRLTFVPISEYLKDMDYQNNKNYIDFIYLVDQLSNITNEYPYNHCPSSLSKWMKYDDYKTITYFTKNDVDTVESMFKSLEKTQQDSLMSSIDTQFPNRIYRFFNERLAIDMNSFTSSKMYECEQNELMVMYAWNHKENFLFRDKGIVSIDEGIVSYSCIHGPANPYAGRFVDRETIVTLERIKIPIEGIHK